ncbi:C-5 cytosine methyltransferase DmtA [Pyrenophora teres f. maculata]|nr:C-5 cytosine methyltransferase DmtA [Pyrenophora teres f. maculata]
MSATATRSYPIPNDDDDDDGDSYDVFDCDSDGDVEVTAFRSCMESPSSSRKTISSEDIKLPDITIQSYKLSKGNIIKPGDTVELQDHTNQPADDMHSGDFLRVKSVIMNLETDQVRLRGHRLRRTKYLRQIFGKKLNELAMVLNVSEDDHHSPLVAGIEDVDIEEVIRMRLCSLTNKPYPFMSFRSGENVAYPVGIGKEEIERQIFHGGQLACRVVKVFYIRSATGKSYGGMARQLYAHEADTNHRDTSNKSIISEDDEAHGSTTANNANTNMVDKKEPPTRKRTRAGRNDQANYESIYTVGPILKKVRPRIATLEQTSGLATSQEHKRNFFILLRDIFEAGYDVRYKVQDLSQLGLVQKRMRLLIIAARRGTPLPPFPKPTHGPDGSGLKPYVDIAEALRDIVCHPIRSMHDIYHQPKLFPVPKPRSYHPSGLRNFTVRELALLQSFPVGYQFAGSIGEVKKQAGNAYPPVTGAAVYREIAKTLDAFDRGLIDAEDDISDLNLDALLRDNDLPTRHGLRSLRDDSGTGGAVSSSSSIAIPSRHQNKMQSPTRTFSSDTGEIIDLLDDEHDEEYIDLLNADDEDGFIDLLDADDEEGFIDLLEDDDDDNEHEGRNQDEDDDDIEYMGTRESCSYF